MTAFNAVLTSDVLSGQASARFVEVPPGLSVSDMIAHALPGNTLSPSRLDVSLVSRRGEAAVAPKLWPHVFPKPGINLRVVVVPGKDELRQVLTIVVSVAAIALAGPLASSLGFASTGLAASLITSGLTIAGTLLVNALIPIQPAGAGGSSAEARRNVYSIQGWRNDARPGESLPSIHGAMRYAPPFAATSYSEIVDDQQYIRALFTPGYGPSRISDLRIGDTPIEDFNNVSVEIREGRSDDGPVAIYPYQVLEDSVGIELVRPLPRNEQGEIIEGPSTPDPEVRFTAADTSRASVILSFPQGLFSVDDDGDVQEQSVTVRIRQRLNGEGSYQDVTTLNLTSDKREAIFRQHSWNLPSRGRWQIEVERISEEQTETDRSDTVFLAALQSIRPEYPINIDVPISLIAVRVRATYQLNGTLDNLNAFFAREGLIHNGDGTWSIGVSSNPATAYLNALAGDENPFPVNDDELDLEQIADWYDFCDAKGLTFNAVLDEGAPLGEILMTICGAGRATPRHDGLKWGVVVDRPDLPVIEHFNDTNADQFAWSRPFVELPDGFRVPFLDETNNYRPAERIVPRPGIVGEPELTEELTLIGKTNPDEVYREATRRFFELIHRPTNYSVMTSMRTRTATRGDLVMASFNELDETHVSARVRDVMGTLVVLDNMIEPNTGLGVRFKVYGSADDAIGASIVSPIADVTEETTAVRVTGDVQMPEVGEVVHIGPLARDSVPLRIRGIEAAEDFNSRVLMVPDAPIIDELLDALVIPPWDGRVGEIVPVSLITPAVPIIRGISAGRSVNQYLVALAPGGSSTAFVTAYQVDVRLQGATEWISGTIDSAEYFFTTYVFVTGDVVEMRARAYSFDLFSEFTSIVTRTMGENAPSPPQQLKDENLVVEGSLGHATITITNTNRNLSDGTVRPSRAEQVRIYRTNAGPGGTIRTFIDGDASRSNILANGDFGSAAGWTLGAGWSIAGGETQHAAGLASDLSRAISASDGDTLRLGFTVTTLVSGSVVPKLTGGVQSIGTPVTSQGISLQSLVASSTTNGFAFGADAAFDGVIDNAALFIETDTCIDAGTYDYYIEPISDEGVAGPVSGPFTVTLI